MTSVWKPDLVLKDTVLVSIVVQITFPGSTTGQYKWDNIFENHIGKSKVNISINSENYVSIGGLTTVFYFSDAGGNRVRGNYSGILQNIRREQVEVEGSFEGTFL